MIPGSGNSTPEGESNAPPAPWWAVAEEGPHLSLVPPLPPRIFGHMPKNRKDLFYGRMPSWALVLIAVVGAAFVYYRSDERDLLITLIQFALLLALVFGLRALGRWHQKRYGQDT